MSAPAILVGNRTGGQGKTLISQLIHCGYAYSGRPIGAVSADSSDAGVSSKLGRILGDVQELGIGANISSVMENQHEAVRYWDELGDRLFDGNCVIDLGANILPLIFQWAAQRNAGRVLRGNPIALVIPVTAQAQSLADAVEMLQASRESELPISNRFIVLNEYHGSFDRLLDNPDYAAITKAVRSHPTTVIKLPKAKVEVWDQIEAKNLSFEKLGRMAHTDWAAEFKVNRFAASGSDIAYINWVRGALEAFEAAGLVPNFPRPNAEGVFPHPQDDSTQAA